MPAPTPSQAHTIAQFRALVWHSLDNGLLDTAIFTAERLVAFDPKSGDAAHLLALCLFRDRQFRQAEGLTKNWLRHVGCAYIYAQCCLQLGGGRESFGINALEGCKRSWNSSTAWNRHTDTDRKSLPDAAAIYCMIGKLWNASGEAKKAIDSYVAAVKANPFLWEAFTGLCNIGKASYGPDDGYTMVQQGVNLRVNNIFKPSAEMIEYCKMPPGAGGAAATVSDDPAAAAQAAQAAAAAARARHATENFQTDPFTSAAQTRDRADLSFSNHPSFFNRLNEGTGSSAHLETPTAQSSASPHDLLLGAANGMNDKPPPVIRKTRAAAADLATRKLTSRSTRDNIADMRRPPTAAGTDSSVPPAPARRSTRLNTLKFGSRLGSADRETRLAAKERDRDQKKRAASARIRSNLMGGVSLAKDRDHPGSGEDVNMPDVPSKTALAPPKPQIDKNKEDAQLYLLDMYRKLGNGYFNLARYHCPEALQAFNALPPSQCETPRIQCLMGKAYYEMAQYKEAEKLFANVRKVDPTRTADMEVFSTILWHQRKDVDLSYLAHELIALDRSSPESWCALGNCFSLQRDHDQALKCFKRATTLNPKLAYAFTLQGHEHVSNEEYEKALLAYRTAVAADNRHYNAWYGLGKVYEKMGKNEVAEKHFRTAAKINPTNAVLVCCVGMVLEKQKDFEGALVQYNSAVKMAPKSSLSRFKKARILMNMHDYHEALKELLILKDLSPNEATVHFSLGRLYKSLHEKGMAIKHLTIALNLDPKAGHLIKDAIENLDDDDSYTAEDSEVYKALDGDQ